MSLSLSQLATHAAKALQQATGPVSVGYAWSVGWSGGDTITVGGHLLPLHHCASPLELRDALSAPSDSSRILLVSVPENHLGQDVLGRLFRHRLLHVDRWQLVQEAYDVHQIDPRLFALKWMPELLLASVPVKRASSATVLTYDEAIECCLSPVLGIAAGQLDLENLLLACELSGQRWSGVSAEVRLLFTQHLVTRLGSLAGAFVAALEAGNSHAIAGMGLVCEVLYAPVAIQTLELRDARVRLEQRLSGLRLKPTDGEEWANLAKRLSLQRTSAARQHDFRTAIELLDAIGASEFVAISTILPEALEQRLDALGHAVTKFLRSTDALPEVEAATQRVLAHQLPPTDHPGPECARMVVRLCRHESKLGASQPSADWVNDYLRNGAWEDWARRTLRGSRPATLARAVTQLLDRVAARRMASDEAFATALAHAAAIGDAPAGALQIESTLNTIVAPLAQHNPLLVLVMDGMSQDVYVAIADSMVRRGLSSWSCEHWPLALLATTPSVTECSRASLFAGRLMQGASNQERQAFAQHEALKRVSRASKPPLLLHKAGLEQSHQLSPEAAGAIADTEQRVVGIVINAIDDALAKSDQVRIDWTLESIPLLAGVLEHAFRAGRVVVLTSDHGHVLERQSVLRPDGEGERWRRLGRAAEQGEITITGPRVNALVGVSLVVPWSEGIRYSVKKNGYHGGVARQEMLVPFGVWTSGDPPDLDGVALQPSYPIPPVWWDPVEGVVATPVVRPPTRRVSTSATPAHDLFSMPPVDDWLDRIMASPLLARQRERAGRMALEPDRLRALLGKLQQQGGRCSIEQMAAAIGQPVMRMRGVMSAMERMLNIDGFPVVTLEQGSGTVLLDISLLKTQFLP